MSRIVWAQRRVRDNALPVLALTALFDVSALVLPHLPGAEIFRLLFLLVIPGALLISRTGAQSRQGFTRLAYAVGASTLLLMVLALAMSVLLPVVGIRHPLDPIPATVAATLLVLGLTAFAAPHGDPVDQLLGQSVPSPDLVFRTALLALLPLAAAGGAELLNNGGSPAIAVLMALLIGLMVVGLAMRSDRTPVWAVSTGLFACALALLWSYSFRGTHPFGFDLQPEFQAFQLTARAGRWTLPTHGDPYRSMLSITALPALLASATRLSGVYLFKAVYPALFALVPAVVFEMCLRWLPRLGASLAAAYLLVLPAFGAEMPALAREEVAVLLATVLVAFAFDDAFDIDSRRLGVAAAGVGIALAHNATAYLTAGALAATWVTYAAVRQVTTGRRNRHRAGDAAGRPRFPLRRPVAVFSIGVVAAVVAGTVLWDLVVTRSSANHPAVALATPNQGLAILPQTDGGALQRWLSAGSPGTIGAAAYQSQSAAQLGKPSSGPTPYADAALYPLVGDTAVTYSGLIPAARPVLSHLVSLTSQFLLVAVAAGLVLLGAAHLRHAEPARGGDGRGWMAHLGQRVPTELLLLGGWLVAIAAALRVGGRLAGYYGVDRFQLHLGFLVAIGLAAGYVAAVGAAERTARGSVVLVVASLVLWVTYLGSSGLATALTSGPASPNLSNASQSAEALLVTDQEVAAASWLAGQATPSAPAFADYYAALRLTGTPGLRATVYATVNPPTLQPGSWVFADEANVTVRQANGVIGGAAALYQFPRTFLDTHKELVFATAHTAIWR